jgi:hypothetical protein
VTSNEAGLSAQVNAEIDVLDQQGASLYAEEHVCK